MSNLNHANFMVLISKIVLFHNQLHQLLRHVLMVPVAALHAPVKAQATSHEA